MDLITAKLAEIAKKKEQVEAEIAERVRRELASSAEVKALAENEQTLIKAAQILGISFDDLASISSPLPEQHPNQLPENKKLPQKWPIPIGDAIEKAMIEAGGSMELDSIEASINAMGVKPSRNSIRSTLSQDKKRFKRSEEKTGVYDLVNRQIQKQEATA